MFPPGMPSGPHSSFTSNVIISRALMTKDLGRFPNISQPSICSTAIWRYTFVNKQTKTILPRRVHVSHPHARLHYYTPCQRCNGARLCSKWLHHSNLEGFLACKTCNGARPCSEWLHHSNLEGFQACVGCNPSRDTMLTMYKMTISNIHVNQYLY